MKNFKDYLSKTVGNYTGTIWELNHIRVYGNNVDTHIEMNQINVNGIFSLGKKNYEIINFEKKEIEKIDDYELYSLNNNIIILEFYFKEINEPLEHDNFSLIFKTKISNYILQ